MDTKELNALATEGANPASMALDTLSARQLVELINAEDRKVAPAVGTQLENIARAVDVIAEKLENGGRLVYMGAGTSGRLGILDASECPPTYGVPPEMVVGLIAGGPEAIKQAQENVEDSLTAGPEQMKAIGFTGRDVLCAIAASGRTPYCLAAMDYAHELGAPVICVTCNGSCPMAKKADIPICPEVGPEVLSGSTRMKSGTAQKMVLNMLTTASMIRLGKVYGPYMVDVQATNEKLRVRSRRIVMNVTGKDEAEAQKALDEAQGQVKLACAMLGAGLSREEAEEALGRNKGRLRPVLEGK